MPQSMTVRLPEHLAGPSPALAEALAKYLKENSDEIEEVLDLDVYYIDNRAEYKDHTVDDVIVDGADIQIDYFVFYFIYFGCDDQNVEDEEGRQIFGKWQGTTVTFDMPAPPPERYPSEEL